MDKQKVERRFVKGSGKEAPFSKDGEVINISLLVDDLIAILEGNPDIHKKGYVQLVVKRKNQDGSPDQYGNTHFIYENTYVPKPKEAKGYVPDTDAVKEKKVIKDAPKASKDDLPF